MPTRLENAESAICAGMFASALDALSESDPRSSSSDDVREEVIAAEALQLMGESEQAVERANAGLRSRHRSDITDAHCLSILALAAFERGEIAQSLQTFRRARRAAQEAQDTYQLCRIQLDMIANLSDVSGPASVTAALRECETCVANLGHIQLRTRLHITTAQIEGKRGHLRQAEEHFGIAEGLLVVAPNAWLEGLMRLNSSTVCGLKTEFSAAIRLAEQALGCAETSGHLRTKLGAIGNLAYLSLWANDIPGARKRCIEGLAIAAHFSEVRIALLETLAQATLAERRGSQCDAILSKIEEATTGDTRFNANWYNVAATLTSSLWCMSRSLTS